MIFLSSPPHKKIEKESNYSFRQIDTSRLSNTQLFYHFKTAFQQLSELDFTAQHCRIKTNKKYLEGTSQMPFRVKLGPFSSENTFKGISKNLERCSSFFSILETIKVKITRKDLEEISEVANYISFLAGTIPKERKKIVHFNNGLQKKSSNLVDKLCGFKIISENQEKDKNFMVKAKPKLQNNIRKNKNNNRPTPIEDEFTISERSESDERSRDAVTCDICYARSQKWFFDCSHHVCHACYQQWKDQCRDIIDCPFCKMGLTTSKSKPKFFKIVGYDEIVKTISIQVAYIVKILKNRSNNKNTYVI